MKYLITIIFAFLLIIACSKKNSDPITGENSSAGDILENPASTINESPSSNINESSPSEINESPTDPLFGESAEEICHKNDNMKQDKCDDDY